MSGGAIGGLSNILDARSRVGVNLTAALPQKELDGSEVALVDGHVFRKLGPGTALADAQSGIRSNQATHLAKSSKWDRVLWADRVSQRHRQLESRDTRRRTDLWLLASLAKAQAIQRQHLLLQAG